MTAYVAVVGPGEAAEGELAVAEEVGAGLAAAGAVVVTGGLGGVMEAACRGARSRLGVTVGLLPGVDRAAANGWVSVAIPTGLGELRNGLIVRASDAVVAIGGGQGTLSEIALALKAGRGVVGLGTWEVPGVTSAASAAEAVTLALDLARRRSATSARPSAPPP
jgi:uncharacterized protein (TIGR00725 family)